MPWRIFFQNDHPFKSTVPKDTLKDVNSQTGGDLFEISEDVACSTVKQKLTF